MAHWLAEPDGSRGCIDAGDLLGAGALGDAEAGAGGAEPTNLASIGLSADAGGRLSVSSRNPIRPRPASDAEGGGRRPGNGRANAAFGQRARATGARAPTTGSPSAGRNIPVGGHRRGHRRRSALIAFNFGSVPAMVVVTAVVTVAAMEAYGAFRGGGYHPATLLGLVATVSLMVATYTKGERALPIVLVLLVVLTFVWHLIGVDRRADPVRSTGATVLVFCWVAVFGSYGALLLAPSEFPHRHGIAFVLGALIAAVAYDVGALLVGGWLGRHPISAASPNKTWEGLVGGTVTAPHLRRGHRPLDPSVDPGQGRRLGIGGVGR